MCPELETKMNVAKFVLLVQEIRLGIIIDVC